VIGASTTRRRFLQLVAGTGVASRAALAATGATVAQEEDRSRAAAALGDSKLLLEFDRSMRSRASRVRSGAGRQSQQPLTPWAVTEYLLLADGTRLQRFGLQHSERESLDGPHGPGTRFTLSGSVPAGVEKKIRIELFERYPGFAFYRVSYRNVSPEPIALRGWRSADVILLSASASGGDRRVAANAPGPGFWSYCGSTHEDRRDWVQPVRAGFSQDNFMGMTASDYGGGTPIVDVWRPDCGIAIGHLELVPQLLSLPVKQVDRGVSLAIAGTLQRVLGPGETFETPETFLATHTGDYFATLDAYRRIMADRGLSAPQPPQSAYEPVWCAWGYERECSQRFRAPTCCTITPTCCCWTRKARPSSSRGGTPSVSALPTRRPSVTPRSSCAASSVSGASRV
jgi:alpha-galactosidase